MAELLPGIIKQLEYYKQLGEKTFAQVPDEGLFWQYNEESNSISMIVNHIAGNLISRWTDFLTTDGEKEWRDRDREFTDQLKSREELTSHWEAGWKCLFDAMNSLNEDQLDTIIYIRNQGHTVTEAIYRSLAHTSYHIGQIVLIGKMLCNHNWTSLSIPRNASKTFNTEKFAREKHKAHFTDEFLSKK